MKNITYILPTNRDYDRWAGQVVDHLFSYLPGKYSFEVIVYGTKPTHGEVIWIEEKEQCGCIKGYNDSVKYANGEYIYVINDDNLMPESTLKAIPFLESDTFRNRKYKVTSVGAPLGFQYDITDMPIKGGQSAHLKNLPPELLHDRFLLPQHRYAIFGYPVLHRSLIDEFNGHIFNPKFKHHYGDNWMSFYIGEMGEFPLVCENTVTSPLPNPPTFNTHDNHDLAVFFDLAVNLINGKDFNYA